MFARLAFSAFLIAAVPATASAGPPWISIELPGNPWDRAAAPDAYLLVHAFHHGTEVEAPLSGRAEGIVDGKRKTITLSFGKTSRPGVYSLKNQWGTTGRWVLVLTVTQHADDVAEAVVQIAEDGSVKVSVPTRPGREGNFPRRVTVAEVDAALMTNARP